MILTLTSPAFCLSILSPACMCAKSLQLCPTLCDPVVCSLPDSSVHEILQARILEWVSFSRGSSWPRDRTHVFSSPSLEGSFFTTSTTWEAHKSHTHTHTHTHTHRVIIQSEFCIFRDWHWALRSTSVPEAPAVTVIGQQLPDAVGLSWLEVS